MQRRGHCRNHVYVKSASSYPQTKGPIQIQSLDRYNKPITKAANNTHQYLRNEGKACKQLILMHNKSRCYWHKALLCSLGTGLYKLCAQRAHGPRSKPPKHHRSWSKNTLPNPMPNTIPSPTLHPVTQLMPNHSSNTIPDTNSMVPNHGPKPCPKVCLKPLPYACPQPYPKPHLKSVTSPSEARHKSLPQNPKPNVVPNHIPDPIANPVPGLQKCNSCYNPTTSKAAHNCNNVSTVFTADIRFT